MNKMKKLLTTLLATTTIFSMAAVPAFAEEAAASAESVLSTSGISVTKDYLSESGSVLPEASFTFTMTPDTSVTNDAQMTDEGLPIRAGLSLGTGGSVTLTYNAADAANWETVTVDGKDGKERVGYFNFTAVTFPEEPAVYRYIVEESAGTNTHIDFNTEKKTYVVDVTVNTDGTPIYAFAWDQSATTKDATTKEPIVFKNMVKTDDLEVNKTVAGLLGSKAQSFDFTIEVPATESAFNLIAGQSFTGTITNRAGGTTPCAITVGDQNEFSLKDGEKLTVTGLPEGTVYIIKEKEYTGYTTTIVCTTATKDKEVSGLEYSACINSTPIEDGGNTVAYTNTNDNTPTGIVLDVAPYLAVLLIVLGGVVTVLVSKRKRTAR